jgi:pyruvate/2-oxoglutarate/acetoin dehydrogenase E1 component
MIQAFPIDMGSEVPDEEYTVPFGKAVVRRPDRDVTVVTTGLWCMRHLRQPMN